MTTFNTGNPLGSTDARDLYDNAENFDRAVNQMTPRWTDRFGVSRRSWAGMAAYVDLGDYADDLLVTGYNEIFRHEGEFYRAGVATVLPYTTTGSWSEDGPYFVPIGDAALRQDIAETADMTIGYYRNAVNCNQFGGLEAALADSDTIGKIIVVTDVQNITENTTVTGRVLCVEYGLGRVNVASTKTLTFDPTSPFTAGAYQVFTGSGTVVGLKEAKPEWWGAKFDGVTNDSAAIQAALTAAIVVKMPAGEAVATFSVPSDRTLSGAGIGSTVLYPAPGQTTVVNVTGTLPDFILSPVLRDFAIDGVNVANGITGLNIDSSQRNPEFTRIKIQNCAVGMRGRRVYNAKFDGLWIQANTIGAVWDSDFNANSFTNCLILNNTTAGIQTQNTDARAFYDKISNTIYNCDLENNGIAIHMQGNSLGVVVDSSYFEANTTWGIKVDGNGTLDDDTLTVINSSFTGSGSRISVGADTTRFKLIGCIANGIGVGKFLVEINTSASMVEMGGNRNYGNGAGIVDAAAVGTSPGIDDFNGTRRLIKTTKLLLLDSALELSNTGLKIPATWNGQHLIMVGPGSTEYHLWIDATGDLRIRGSAPDSDTAGAVVGTQT